MLQPDPDFWWNWPVQFSVAIGTLLAFAVALFGPWFQARFFPPVLLLNLARINGERCEVTHVMMLPGGLQESAGVSDGLYFHLRVSNYRRRTPATNTLVYLSKIEEFEGGVYKEKWTGNMPLGWRHPDIFKGGQIVGPHVDCDLCSIISGDRIFKHLGKSTTPNYTAPQLSIFPVSPVNNLKTYSGRAGAINMILTVQARSNEVDSEEAYILIRWDGLWSNSDDEMRRHLQVKFVDSL